MITIEMKGRLGNQMFEYATCRSIAEKFGYNYYIQLHPFWANNIEKFNIPLGKIDGIIKYKLNGIYCAKYIHENNKLPVEYLNIQDNTELDGYFQKSEFFDFNYENIKKWFNVDNLIDDKVYSTLMGSYNNYCFIHNRGTDFIGGNELPISYYYKSMEKMKESFYNIKFVILTDDIDYSKKLFPNITVLSNPDDLIDFKLLQQSKYLISSNSTFSWWAAYLNNNAKKIIYPFGGLVYGKDEHTFTKCKKFNYV